VTRRRELEWAPDRRVEVVTEGGGSAVIILAHGAGAGQAHPFMAGMRRRLAAAGYTVVTFDYPYIAEGRKAPDRVATLLECHRRVVESMAADADALLLGGKSMGGRLASHLAVDAAGLFFLGYPLVPVGKREPRDTAHLEAIEAPMLFVQGERDRLAPLDLLRPLVGSLPRATLVAIPEADHSFKVPKRTGIGEEQMRERLAATVDGWLSGIL